MNNQRKYWAALDVEQRTNYERQYLYLLDRVQGGVVLHERDINRISEMSREEIIAMLSSMPRCREQAVPD